MPQNETFRQRIETLISQNNYEQLADMFVKGGVDLSNGPNGEELTDEEVALTFKDGKDRATIIVSMVVFQAILKQQEGDLQLETFNM